MYMNCFEAGSVSWLLKVVPVFPPHTAAGMWLNFNHYQEYISSTLATTYGEGAGPPD